MKTSKIKIIIPILLLLAAFPPLFAGWEVTVSDSPAPGYIRFDWGEPAYFYLYDNYGEMQYADTTTRMNPMGHFLALQDGTWICSNNENQNHLTNYYFVFNENMQIIDSIPYPEGYPIDFHDVIVLSNGHYLLLCQEEVSVDMSEYVEDGYQNATLLSNAIFETDNTGEIYWEWHAIDHFSVLDIADTNELKSVTIDFTHINSFLEDENGDIWLSVRHFDEVVKIDKSTGNIVWRLGGSMSKNNDFTFVNDTSYSYVGFSQQHSISLLPNGNLLLFDNGCYRSPQYSRAVEYSLDMVHKTATKVWEYRADPDIYADIQGSAYRLANGNTIINWTYRKVTEVRPDGTIAFQMEYQPDNPSEPDFGIYRVYRVIRNMEAVIRNINSTGEVVFTNQTDDTGVRIDVSSLNGTGMAWLEKHFYSPPGAFYDDSSYTAILPYRWVLTSVDVNDISGTFKIKANTLENLTDPSKVTIYKRDMEAVGLFRKLETYYDAASGDIFAEFSGFGEFSVGETILEIPQLFAPVNNTLSAYVRGSFLWSAVDVATNYQIQVSTDTDFNELIMDIETEAGTNSLEYNDYLYLTTYYWRVRCFNSKDTSEWSDANCFTTLPIPDSEITYPEDNFIGFKDTSMFRWVKIEGPVKYRVQIADNRNFILPLIDSSDIAESVYRPENLEYNKKYYFRMYSYQDNDTSLWSSVIYFTTTLHKPELVLPEANSVNNQLSGELIWNSVEGAENYCIEISDEPDFSNIKKIVKEYQDTVYKYTDLEHGTNYYWRVFASRDNDTSYWSAIWNFHTVLEEPKPLYPSYNQENVETSIVFIWDSMATATSYWFQAAEDEDFVERFLDTMGIKTNSLFIDEIPPGRKLYWRIMAFKDNQYSEWSLTYPFTSGADEEIVKPVLLSPADESENYISGQLEWKKTERAKKYLLQISKEGDFSDIAFKSETNDTIYIYDSLEYGEKYFWRVKAYSLYDSSSWSDVWILYTYDNTLTFVSPANDAMQVDLIGSITWKAIEGADSYNLQISFDEDFKKLEYDIYGLTEPSYKYEGLEPNREYFRRVRYIKETDTSDWSAEWPFTTLSGTSLDVPILSLPGTNTKGVSVNGIFSWEPVSGAEKYRLSISKNIEFTGDVQKFTNITDNYLNYSGLKYNKQYYWRVVALNSDAMSNWSEIQSFITELEAPHPGYPENNAENVDAAEEMSWPEISGAEEYHLQIAEGQDFNSGVIIDEKLSANKFVYELSPGLLYSWRIKALNKKTESKWSDVFSFTTLESQDVNDIQISADYCLYPNPAGDYLMINGIDASVAVINIRMFDILGNEVFLNNNSIKTNTNNIMINLSGVREGIYLVQLNYRNEIQVMRFIKAN